MIQYNKEYPIAMVNSDNAIDGYTSVRPLGWKYFPDIPEQHFDGTEWILDSENEDDIAVERLNAINQVLLIEILDGRGELDKLITLLNNSDKFNLSWAGAGGVIRLNHPLTQQALQSVDIDIVAVKREVLSR